jgi:hypothetical protein
MERWRSIPEIIRAGHGDCEDLSAWLIAECRIAGMKAFPDVVGRGDGKWHIRVKIVKAATGEEQKEQIVDPSKELGM